MIRGNANPDPRRLQRAQTKRAARRARNIRDRFRELDTADARRAGEKWDPMLRVALHHHRRGNP